MTIWMTSDTHFGHGVLISGEMKRPFNTTAEMDRKLIKNINDSVAAEDILFILGDFTMVSPERRSYVEGILRKLNGKKILILGNHDRFTAMQYVDMGFYQVCTHYETEFDGIKVWMCHDPAWANLVPKTDIVLCGHVHKLFKQIDNVVNVGVDVWNYKPVSFNLVCTYALNAIKDKKF